MIRYDKHSIDYKLNMMAFHEMNNCVPMTKPERDAVRNWVKNGYELESNPWDYKDCDGQLLNYLQAYRLNYGYSSGPWDYWKGPDTQAYWDDYRKCFISKEDYC